MTIDQMQLSPAATLYERLKQKRVPTVIATALDYYISDAATDQEVAAAIVAVSAVAAVFATNACSSNSTSTDAAPSRKVELAFWWWVPGLTRPSSFRTPRTPPSKSGSIPPASLLPITANGAWAIAGDPRFGDRAEYQRVARRGTGEITGHRSWHAGK
jgi:hypothetical protein